MSTINYKKFDLIEIQTIKNSTVGFATLLSTLQVIIDPNLQIGEKEVFGARVFINYQDYIKIHAWEAKDILEYLTTLKEVSTDAKSNDTSSK